MAKLRRKRKRKIKGVFIMILLLFLILVYVFLFSPLFKIRSLEVLGNKEVSTEEIKSNFSYSNIFLITEEKIKNDLFKKFPKISDLEINKNLIKRVVKLTIKEREGVGIVCKGETPSCFYVDRQGIIFEEAPQTSGSLILLIKDYSGRDYQLGEKIFEENLINSILEARDGLSSEIDIKTLDFDILSFPPSDFKAVTGEGWHIIFSLERDIKSQVLALKAALEEKIKDREGLEYIDLRIENRVYYK